MGRIISCKMWRRSPVLTLSVAVPLLLLVWITQVAVAQRDDLAAKRPPAVTLGDGVQVLGDAATLRVPQNVIRIQTATLLVPPVDPPYDLVPVTWQNDWRGFSTSMGLKYPTDVMTQDVVVLVEPPTLTWEFWPEVNTVAFLPPTNVVPFTYNVFLAYTTSVGTVFTDDNDVTYNFQVKRRDSNNLLDGSLGGWLTTGYFQFTATMVFPPPFEFVWATAIPTDILSYTLEPGPDPHWVSWNVQDAVSFRGNVTLRDPRYHSDLVVESLTVDPPSPVAGDPAMVTAVVRNVGEVHPDTFFYTEWYARPVGYGPPENPDDHYYGWCAFPPPGDCGNGGVGRYEFIFDAVPATIDHPLPAFPDPVLALGPGQAVTLSRVYWFPVPGTVDLWAQVDVDVQHTGLTYGPNLEMNESNNVLLGPTITVLPGSSTRRVFLPLVLRSR